MLCTPNSASASSRSPQPMLFRNCCTSCVGRRSLDFARATGTGAGAGGGSASGQPSSSGTADSLAHISSTRRSMASVPPSSLTEEPSTPIRTCGNQVQRASVARTNANCRCVHEARARPQRNVGERYAPFRPPAPASPKPRYAERSSPARSHPSRSRRTQSREGRRPGKLDMVERVMTEGGKWEMVHSIPRGMRPHCVCRRPQPAPARQV